MNNKIFYAMNLINDEFVLETIPEFCKQRLKVRKYAGKMKYIAAIVAAMLILIITASPTLAKNLPFIGNVFTYIQERMDFAGKYSNYADEIGENAYSNGISVTISEAYCDGINLFISYQIQTEKPFSDYTKKEFLRTQLDYSASVLLNDYPDLKLDDFGVVGLEGEFIDEYTFVGAETYSLGGQEFPESFKLDISIYSWNLILEDMSEKRISGKWKFNIPISINFSDIQTLEINETSDGHTIDKVVISPIMITIYSSYPDIYSGTVNYEVTAFSNLSDRNIVMQGVYDKTEGITRVPRNSVGDTLDIYAIDYSKLDGAGLEKYSQENIAGHAIVHTKIELQ